MSCKFRDDWPNNCWLLSIYVLSHTLLKIIGHYLENKIRYQQALCNFSSAWSNDDPQRILKELDEWPRRRCQKCVFQKIQNGRKSNMADLMGSVGKVVEFDPKNVYTKFHVNRTYGLGVMNFKVKKQFFFNYSAPIRPIGVKLLGFAHNFQTRCKISCLYHLPSHRNLRKHFWRKGIIINQHKNNRVSALRAWTPNNSPQDRHVRYVHSFCIVNSHLSLLKTLFQMYISFWLH